MSGLGTSPSESRRMCVSSARLLDQRQPQAEYPWSNHPSCARGDNACVSPLESWANATLKPAKYARGKHGELCCSISESYSGSQFLLNPKKKGRWGWRTLRIPVVWRVVPSCSLGFPGVGFVLKHWVRDSEKYICEYAAQRDRTEGAGAATVSAPGVGPSPCVPPRAGSPAQCLPAESSTVPLGPIPSPPTSGAVVFGASLAPSTAAFSGGLESFCQQGGRCFESQVASTCSGTFCHHVSLSFRYPEVLGTVLPQCRTEHSWLL